MPLFCSIGNRWSPGSSDRLRFLGHSHLTERAMVKIA